MIDAGRKEGMLLDCGQSWIGVSTYLPLEQAGRCVIVYVTKIRRTSDDLMQMVMVVERIASKKTIACAF